MALHINETEVKYNKIKINNVLAEVYYIPSSNNSTVILFCYGIPSHPFDRFPFGLELYLKQGYILVYSHYEGTFGSDGLCTIVNAVDSVVMTARALFAGELSDLISGESFNLEPRRVVLAGGSFGGSVALIVAAKSKEVKDVISVAGPIDYRGMDFSKLEGKPKEAYQKEWSISPEAWESFLHGRIDINPIDYIDQLEKKNTYLIHAEIDPVVLASHSIKLYEILKDNSGKHRILIEPNVGHVGCHYIGIDHVHNLVESWLNG